MATQPFSDLVLFPHCDLHMVLEGTPAPPTLTLRVAVRTGRPSEEQYSLKDAANPRFDFFAPNNLVGHRLDSTDLPTVENGAVRATKAGVYLFQVRVGDKTPDGKSMSIVGRLQVHKKLEKWWFGNDSITTALDPKNAHAQPSIYARFTAGEKVDEVGDITGHNYVQLTSQDTNKVRVAAPEGRLYGLVATPDPGPAVKITGSFPSTKDQSLDVYVVNYAQPRTVDVVSRNDLSNIDDMQNILFLPEGFREADLSRFESTVEHVVKEMFEARRHEPYVMLQDRFNVFRSNAASRQDTVTPGFRVTDNTTVTNSTGHPIPYNGNIYLRDPKNTYTMDQLVQRVGLPIRGEQGNRDTFLKLWNLQSLNDFKDANVSEKLFTAWKAHSSLGILSARDTFFGFQLGRRWAERYSDTGEVEPPENDKPDDAQLKPFVARVYSFFTTEATRTLALDPRRHPPELYAGSSYENPNTSLMQYVRGLQHGTTDIGRVWVPEDKFKRSRGLIAVIAFDQFSGGTNINALTITAQTTNREQNILYEYSTDPNKDPDPAVMRRDTTHVTFPIDITRVANVVTHEFGHSFNLGDEYEEAGKTNDDPNVKASADISFDNLTRLGAIHTGPDPNSRVFDPRKIKWLGLPRIAHSARLVKASEEVPGVGIKVFIDPGSIPGWVVLQSAGVHVNLRKFAPTDRGVQLPLKLEDNTEYAPDLSIVDFNWGGGTLTLKGAKLPPPTNYSGFGTGSLLFVPVKQNNQPVSVVRAEVLAFLLAKIKPLNSDRDNKFAKSGPDTPLPIPNLRSRLQRGLIGLYEGANYYPGGNYRPAGACKMRDQNAEGESGEFCHVCKWLIVNRIDPSWHAWLELSHYPGGQP